MKNTFKSIGGISIALLIGGGTLFFLLSVFNKTESEKVSSKDVHTEVLTPGNINFFPQWDELSEFPPESVIRYYGTKDGEIVFDVKYRTDKYGFRIEERPSGPQESHLIIGGCSFIFGVAINQEDTVTSILRKKIKSVNAVNAGHGGGGLHTQLRMFELINMKEYAPEENGTYVYLFFLDHINRWKADPSYLAWAQMNDVHYKQGTDGKFTAMLLRDSPEYKKFQEAKKAGLEMVYIKANATVNYKWTDEEIDHFLKGVTVLKKKYLETYPKGKFVFAFHPYTQDAELFRRISEGLAKYKIEYQKLTDFSDPELFYDNLPKKEFFVPVDGHPNKKFNDYLSDKLINKLGLL